MTGALRREISIAGSDKIYNSILTFDGLGNVVAQYDKWRLVPGGEFLPFEWLLEPLGFRRVVTVPGSFAAGRGRSAWPSRGRRPLDFRSAMRPFSPIISLIPKSGRDGLSMSPMTAGLETQPDLTSIWRRPGCGPLNRGCPWSGRQIREFPRSLTPMAGSSRACL